MWTSGTPLKHDRSLALRLFCVKLRCYIECLYAGSVTGGYLSLGPRQCPFWKVVGPRYDAASKRIGIDSIPARKDRHRQNYHINKDRNCQNYCINEDRNRQNYRIKFESTSTIQVYLCTNYDCADSSGSACCIVGSVGSSVSPAGANCSTTGGGGKIFIT